MQWSFLNSSFSSQFLLKFNTHIFLFFLYYFHLSNFILSRCFNLLPAVLPFGCQNALNWPLIGDLTFPGNEEFSQELRQVKQKLFPGPRYCPSAYPWFDSQWGADVSVFWVESSFWIQFLFGTFQFASSK